MNATPMPHKDLQHTRHPAIGRQASSLIEVMVAVTLLALIMGVVLALFVGLRKRDRAFREQDEQIRQSLRLVETLRRDIRQSTSVTLPAANSLLIASTSDREIKYTLTPDGCERQSSHHGGADMSRDLFAIGTGGTWTFEQGPPGRKPLAIVAVKLKKTSEEQPDGFPAVVCAAIGADAQPAALPNDAASTDEPKP
jgi:type II secretory pathway pseudopilin PulG